MSNNSDNTLKIGTVINNKWVILEFIGKGGMGEVYRAHQTNLKRDVAIKIISREWLESLEDNEEEMETGLQRFRNEVQAMAQIRHLNILQIYDYGSFSIKKGDEDITIEYIAMEYIPGGSLRSTMSDDGFYPEEELTSDWILDYFLPVLDGIHALHEAGIIHRDLKPGNVLMDGKTPKIADFGLARSSKMRPVTKSIDVKGTPAYMSPEHFMDLRRTDIRADIYSLGKILFEAIDGKMTSNTIPFKQVTLPNPETQFFQKLDQTIKKATAEDRNDRLSSVEKFRNEIMEATRTARRNGVSAASSRTGSFSIFVNPKWIWSGITVATLSILLMTLWHLLSKPEQYTPLKKEQAVIIRETEQVKFSASSGAVSQDNGSPPLTLKGKDGATMRMISEGTFILPKRFGRQAGKSVQVDAFFMDETEVTNHQYVTFLNQVLSRISVKGEVVKGDNTVWLLLGEPMEGYEPIVYGNGRFVIKDPVLHSHPVVRITPYGATAYARFYGKRLPTETEWLHARGNTGETEERSPDSLPASSGPMGHMEMMRGQTDPSSSGKQAESKLPLPVVQLRPNEHGIRGLTGNVREWGKITGPRYLILPSAISRQPWEAFEDVGFRTALSIPSGD